MLGFLPAEGRSWLYPGHKESQCYCVWHCTTGSWHLELQLAGVGPAAAAMLMLSSVSPNAAEE